MAPRYRLHVAPGGNVFMAELADLVAHGLADLGRTVERAGPELPQAQPGVVDLVVAPHEYFTLAARAGADADRLAEAAASVVALCTEQPGTPWFDDQVAWCTACPLVLDINPWTAARLRRLGLAARHLPLGYHRTLDRWGGDPAAPRPVDVTVLAAANPRRFRLLARAAPLLWDRACDLRLFTFERPAGPDTPGFLTGTAKLDHLARSRVLLNVHRDELPYFEWLRVVEALANGCVVLTEPSVGLDPLVPFEHLVVSGPDELGAWAQVLCADEAWRSRLAAAAYDLLRAELDFVRRLEPLAAEMEDVAAGGPVPGRPRPVPPATGPPPVPPRRPAQVLLEEVGTAERDLFDRAKHLLNAQRTTLRRLEGASAALDGRSEEIWATPSWAGARPDVSVVLTNYNYGALVGRALASVAASAGVRPEVVVVDDHSTDDSLAVLAGLVAERPWLPTLVVAKPANQGLSAARNTGLGHARADLVFVLDADNEVYPTGLAALVGAIGPGDAFAYGVVDTFADGDGAPVGLVSALPFDLPFLCRGNYIDAMALLRRSAVLEAGGYDAVMDERHGGWEDYDLWLRLADRGWSAAAVARPVGRYRVHPASMLSAFNLTLESAVAELVDRYPRLPFPDEVRHPPHPLVRQAPDTIAP
jgi:hypothetical protein